MRRKSKGSETATAEQGPLFEKGQRKDGKKEKKNWIRLRVRG